MSNVIRFPAERSAGCKRQKLMDTVEELLHLRRVDDSIDMLDAVAVVRRRTRMRQAAEFKRDQVRPIG